MNIKIKKEHYHEVVGYNNSGLPLGKRDDLYLLAELAHHNPALQKYFEKLPTLKQIEKYKADLFITQQKALQEPDGQQNNNSTEPSQSGI